MGTARVNMSFSAAWVRFCPESPNPLVRVNVVDVIIATKTAAMNSEVIGYEENIRSSIFKHQPLHACRSSQ